MKDINKLAILKITLSIVIGIVGIVTIIFSILNLAHSTSVKSNEVLIILGGIILLIFGLAFGIYSLFQESNQKLLNLMLAAVFVGFGAFSFTQLASDIVNVVITYIFPIIASCFGGFLFIRGIIETVRKSNKLSILHIILGASLLAGGILLAHFYKETGPVIWLLVGIGIVVFAVWQIILAIKNKPSISEKK